jgi:hypothetical protein
MPSVRSMRSIPPGAVLPPRRGGAAHAPEGGRRMLEWGERRAGEEVQRSCCRAYADSSVNSPFDISARSKRR